MMTFCEEKGGTVPEDGDIFNNESFLWIYFIEESKQSYTLNSIGSIPLLDTVNS